MKTSKNIGKALLVVAAFFVSATAANAAEKVRVCHIEDGATAGKVIQVTEKAADAHLKHGDPAVFVIKEDGSCEKYVEMNIRRR